MPPAPDIDALSLSVLKSLVPKLRSDKRRRQSASVLVIAVENALLRYPNYGALTSTPAGLTPAEHASLLWTHNAACGLVTRVAFTHAATLCNASGSRSEGWKTRTREISGKIDDVLARAACDFEDDALRRQDITKDTENEIAIAQCCRGVLAKVVYHPHGHCHIWQEEAPSPRPADMLSH